MLRASSSKYSTRDLASINGLSAASRAMPTNGAGAGNSTALVSLFLRLLSRPWRKPMACLSRKMGKPEAYPTKLENAPMNIRRFLFLLNRAVVGAFNDNCFEIAKSAAYSSVLSDRKSTRLNSSHIQKSRMPSSA